MELSHATPAKASIRGRRDRHAGLPSRARGGRGDLPPRQARAGGRGAQAPDVPMGSRAFSAGPGANPETGRDRSIRLPRRQSVSCPSAFGGDDPFAATTVRGARTLEPARQARVQARARPGQRPLHRPCGNLSIDGRQFVARRARLGTYDQDRAAAPNGRPCWRFPDMAWCAESRVCWLAIAFAALAAALPAPAAIATTPARPLLYETARRQGLVGKPPARSTVRRRRTILIVGP